MASQLQNLSDVEVDVLVDGDWKASGTLEDLRHVGDDRRIHEQVYLRIGDYDASWARQLPRAGRGDERGALSSFSVDIKLDDEAVLTGASLGRPWTEAIGARVEDLAFPLSHNEL